MTRPSFLFVIKTSDSARLGGSNGAEAAAIQHFVQRGRKRARKSIAGPAVRKAPYSTQGEDALQKEHSSVPQTRACDRTIPDTLLYAIGSGVDPFHVCSVNVNGEIQSLLHYYTTIYHPTLWPNETQALRRGAYIFEDGVNRIVQYSMQDDLAMYCLLASASSRLIYLDKLPFLISQAKTDWYMKRALHLMQQRIDRQASQREGSLLYLLQYIIFLSAAEAYRNGPVASRIHLEAAVKLLAYEGMTIAEVGSENLQGMMLMSDLFLSCVNLEPCLFDSKVYDPGPVSTLELSTGELLILPVACQHMGSSLHSCGVLSPATRELVCRIVEVYVTKMCLDTTRMSSARALETTHWITKRSMAVRNDLLSGFSASSPADYGVGVQQSTTTQKVHDLYDKAVRVALIQFTLLSMNITRRIKTVKIMAPFLQHLLIQLSQERPAESSGSDELMMWLLVIGCSCARDASETEIWFKEQLLKMMKKIFGLGFEGSRVSCLAKLEWSQSDYFYHAAVQRPRLKYLLS